MSICSSVDECCLDFGLYVVVANDSIYRCAVLFNAVIDGESSNRSVIGCQMNDLVAVYDGVHISPVWDPFRSCTDFADLVPAFRKLLNWSGALTVASLDSYFLDKTCRIRSGSTIASVVDFKVECLAWSGIRTFNLDDVERTFDPYVGYSCLKSLKFSAPKLEVLIELELAVNDLGSEAFRSHISVRDLRIFIICLRAVLDNSVIANR